MRAFEKIEVPVADRMIDVEKALKEKKPKLYKWMPGFVLRYIIRLLHQKEINQIMYKNRESRGVEFVNKGLVDMDVHSKSIGLENLPKEGGVYLAANHPLGGLDGVAFIQEVAKVRGDMKFFVNDVLMQMKNLDEIFVPVNKFGKNDKAYRKRFEEIYQSDHCLLIFPAGLVSRRQKGRVIEDLQWKKSIVQKAVQYDKPIVPVYIDARNSNKFYNLAYWRKKLGIKAKIEMFYLSDEMFKQHGKTITFTFGKPIMPSSFTSDKKPEEWVLKLKRYVYSLKENKDAEFH